MAHNPKKHTHYRHHDEARDPVTGEWTCPGCTRRVMATNRSGYMRHLCYQCSEGTWDLRRRDRQAREGATGLVWRGQWDSRSTGWYSWVLLKGGVNVGSISASIYRQPGNAKAFVRESDRLFVEFATGTIAECALALVHAMRGES